MADHVVPHFHNDPGVPLSISAPSGSCASAPSRPFDHPHVFLDMGGDKEIICPYCSTLYRHDSSLDSHSGASGGMRDTKTSLRDRGTRRDRSRTIIIGGGGIGGLTAALALAQRGFRTVVLDQAARPEESARASSSPPMQPVSSKNSASARGFAPWQW